MKKLFAILAVSAFVFAACGQKAETEPTNDEATNTTEMTTQETAPIDEPAQDMVEGQEGDVENVDNSAAE